MEGDEGNMGILSELEAEASKVFQTIEDFGRFFKD